MAHQLFSSDKLSAPYWEHAAKHELAFPRCRECGRGHFYPRPACPHCGSERLNWEAVSGLGTVYSYSVVHRAPSAAFADDVPYVIAIVEIEPGLHLLSRVIDVPPEMVRIGMRVRVRFEAVSDEQALPVFAPEVKRS